MRHLARMLLVVALALAALVPPRLHAMAMAAAPAHAPHGLVAAADPCHKAPHAPTSADRAAQTLCLTACACLPAVDVMAVPTRWAAAGERLGPAIEPGVAYDEPDVPLRPPCAAA